MRQKFPSALRYCELESCKGFSCQKRGHSKALRRMTRKPFKDWFPGLRGRPEHRGTVTVTAASCNCCCESCSIVIVIEEKEREERVEMASTMQNGQERPVSPPTSGMRKRNCNLKPLEKDASHPFAHTLSFINDSRF